MLAAFWLGKQASQAARRSRAVRELYARVRKGDTPQIRALRLLRSWLSPEQLAQLETSGYFDVIGGTSGRKYRIKFGVCANILEFDGRGEPKAGWCFVPESTLVPGDVMLAQKIALETCEREALAVANKFGPPVSLRAGSMFIS
jgi:hypothetical protein